MKAAINKSAAIREQLAKHPTFTAREIVAELGFLGVKVTEALVYNIRSTVKAKPVKKVAAPPPVVKYYRLNGQTAALAMMHVTDRELAGASAKTVVDIKAVTSLAKEVGGLAALRQIVDAMVEA